MKKLLKEDINRLKKLAGIKENNEDIELYQINEFLVERISEVVNDYLDYEVDSYVSGGTPDRETYSDYAYLYIEYPKKCIDALKKEFNSIRGEDKEILDAAMKYYNFKDINDLAKRAVAWAEEYLSEYEATESDIEDLTADFDTFDYDEELKI